MAKFTNYTRGPRGISLKDGSTRWLNPGESADIAKGEVVEPLPDLGRQDDIPADSAEFDGLKELVAALTKQVEDGATAQADLTKALEDEKANSAALTKQVEELTAAAAKQK